MIEPIFIGILVLGVLWLLSYAIAFVGMKVGTMIGKILKEVLG